MKFSSEADVRRWLRRHRPTWWVENKRGGTQGFPDAVVAGGHGAVFLELKLAEPRGPAGWVLKASPAQLQTIRGMQAAGLRALVLAGIAGTDLLGALEGAEGLVRVGRTSRAGGRTAYRVLAWSQVWNSADGWPPELG